MTHPRGGDPGGAAETAGTRSDAGEAGDAGDRAEAAAGAGAGTDAAPRQAETPAPAPAPEQPQAPEEAPQGDGTRLVRAGLPEPLKHDPSFPGPVFAAHYHLPGDPTGPYTYGRDENPTWTRLEAALTDLEAPGLEGAATLVFASGMAAISAVAFSQLRAGDAVVLPADGYQALPLLGDQLAAFGIEVRRAPTGGDAQLDVLDGARLLCLETPSNPGLDVCDVRRLVTAAHAQGTLVAVDNTLATPLGQRPLDLGADFAVASGTKQLTGHADVLLGYVTAADPALLAPVRRWRKIAGAVQGPMEAWLAHRSLATLHLRAERQNANALALAGALAGRPEVTGLRYPGLPSDPGHRVAAAQMRRFGCVLSFTLPSRDSADRFLAALRLVDDATSFGGVRSTAERRGRWGGDDVAEGFIRFSAGAEDTDDLVRDVLHALDASQQPPAA